VWHFLVESNWQEKSWNSWLWTGAYWIYWISLNQFKHG
jgi:hypothetical protein